MRNLYEQIIFGLFVTSMAVVSDVINRRNLCRFYQAQLSQLHIYKVSVISKIAS